jgi:thiol-disulfide isomerase/thioredoxin
MYMNRLLFLLPALLLMGCGPETPADVRIVAHLTPGDQGSDLNLSWSPKAAAVPLQENGDVLEGSFVLGDPDASAFGVRLSKSGNTPYFDELWIDLNRNAAQDEGETLLAEPREVRYSMWSSFKTVLDVGVTDPQTGEVVVNPYPMSLWYVQDLREPSQEHALRFTRNGWMQGRVVIDGVDAHIRLSESLLDGMFTMEDGWTLALPDSFDHLFDFNQERPGGRHAWLGEKAYRLSEVNPTGRMAYLEPIDPGVTRAKEAQDDDQTAVDRRAAHSGGAIAFREDFAAAEKEAREAGKTLFIDFETVWCGPCKTMEEWVYTADVVVEAAESVISVKVDGDDFPDIVDRFGVTGYPTMVKLDASGEVTGKLVGYQGVESMKAFLEQ